MSASTETCSLFCKNGSAKYDPDELKRMGCRKEKTAAGTVIKCPVSCSTMMRSVYPQGMPIKVGEEVALAVYSHHGADFEGYIVERQCSNPIAQVGNLAEHNYDEHNIFGIRKTLSERKDTDFPAPEDLKLPKIFKIEEDEMAIAMGRKQSNGGVAKYGSGTTYKIFTSWEFKGSPNVQLSRRQDLQKVLPTTSAVMCFHSGKNRAKDFGGRIECAYDNSHWMFVPADGATKDGESVCHDDLFYLVEYPGIGKSRYLRWNPDTGNFDLVQETLASIFQFPAQPLETSNQNPLCQFVSGNSATEKVDETPDESLGARIISSIALDTEELAGTIVGVARELESTEFTNAAEPIRFNNPEGREKKLTGSYSGGRDASTQAASRSDALPGEKNKMHWLWIVFGAILAALALRMLLKRPMGKKLNGNVDVAVRAPGQNAFTTVASLPGVVITP